MRATLMAMVFGVAACVGGKGDDTDETGAAVEACDLAESSQTCPECSNGEITCSFVGISATAPSCGDCQARGLLYQQLCDEGVVADAETIEADTVCAPPSCVVITDNCQDPCAPLCVRADSQGGDAALSPATTTCDIACADTAVEDPGECVWDGFGCVFQ